MGRFEESSGHALVMFPPSVKLPALFSRDNNSHMEMGTIVRSYILILILEPTYVGNFLHSLAVVRISNSFR